MRRKTKTAYHKFAKKIGKDEHTFCGKTREIKSLSVKKTINTRFGGWILLREKVKKSYYTDKIKFFGFSTPFRS